MLLTRIVVLLVLLIASTSCKIQITTSPNGQVESNSGVHNCSSDSPCDIHVSDAFFDETFRAVPNQGYRFAAWRTKTRAFCGGQNQPCRLTTTGFLGTPLMNFLETDDVFYLEPVFGMPNTWIPGVELPVASVAISTCVVRGKLYAFGLAHHGNVADVDRRVEEFDPTTQSWTRKADIPNPRVWATASAVKNRCYLIGGSGSAGTEVEEYNPATDTWRARAPLPEGRQALASAVVQGKIYVLGGSTLGAGWFRPAIPSVAIYDPVINEWSKGADMPEPRGGLVAGAIGDYIYTIGGTSPNLMNSDLVHRYDPVNDQWIAVAPIPAKAASESIDGQIYALGGRSDRSFTTLADVEVYTPVD